MFLENNSAFGLVNKGIYCLSIVRSQAEVEHANDIFRCEPLIDSFDNIFKLFLNMLGKNFEYAHRLSFDNFNSDESREAADDDPFVCDFCWLHHCQPGDALRPTNLLFTFLLSFSSSSFFCISNLANDSFALFV